MRSANPPPVNLLTNAELRFVLRSVGEIWIHKVVAFFKEQEIEGAQFQEFQADGFSDFEDVAPALLNEIKYACNRAHAYVHSPALRSPKLDAAEQVHSHRRQQSTSFHISTHTHAHVHMHMHARASTCAYMTYACTYNTTYIHSYTLHLQVHVLHGFILTLVTHFWVFPP